MVWDTVGCKLRFTAADFQRRAAFLHRDSQLNPLRAILDDALANIKDGHLARSKCRLAIICASCDSPFLLEYESARLGTRRSHATRPEFCGLGRLLHVRRLVEREAYERNLRELSPSLQLSLPRELSAPQLQPVTRNRRQLQADFLFIERGPCSFLRLPALR
jgi:hypothetical protein